MAMAMRTPIHRQKRTCRCTRHVPPRRCQRGDGVKHGSRLPVNNPGPRPPMKQYTGYLQYSSRRIACIPHVEHVLVRVLMHVDSAIWTHRQQLMSICDMPASAATSISPPQLQTLRYRDDEDIVRPWR